MSESKGGVPLLFVVGSGRSGTTVYQEVLNSFSRLHSFTRLSAACPPTTYWSGWMRRTGFFPASLVRPSGEAQKILGEAGLTVDLQRQLRRRLTSADAEDLNAEALRRRVSQLQRSTPGKSMVIIKNTLNSARVEALGKSFPEAVFHHVVRHPGRVIESLMHVEFFEGMQLWWDGRTVERYAAEESVSREVVAARHWSRQVEDCLEGLASVCDSRKATISYANFVQEPEVVARSALRKVGLEDAGQFLSGVSVKLERTSELSEEAARAVDQECGSVLARLDAAI